MTTEQLKTFENIKKEIAPYKDEALNKAFEIAKADCGNNDNLDAGFRFYFELIRTVNNQSRKIKAIKHLASGIVEY